MRLAGLLLLPAGWVIVLSAIGMLPQGGARGAFILAGFAVEVLGLVLAIRGHIPEFEEKR